MLDQLLEGRDPRAVLSRDGLFDELKKALAERVLNADLHNHLTATTDGSKNRRNGYSKKTVLTEKAKIDVRIPRDREGAFDPKLSNWVPNQLMTGSANDHFARHFFTTRHREEFSFSSPPARQ
jgi:transposase-like protein